MKKRFNFKNQQHNKSLSSIPNNLAVAHDSEKKVTTLNIYGEIGDGWWEDSTSALDIDTALKEANGNDLVVRLNSPGGSAFDGVAIYNLFMTYKKEKGARIRIHIDGWACSAASIIAMAADELIMELGSMLMIHEASTIVWGSKYDFRKQADMLETLEDGIIDIYMTKANVSREDIRKMVDAETWFSASEAVEIGFATSTTTVEDEEFTSMKAQMQSMQHELQQLKNQQKKEPTPEPVIPTNKRKGFLF